MSNRVLVNTYEVNKYDDSDGTALVYNRDSDTLSRIKYWTTRASIPAGALDGISRDLNSSDIDATRAIILKELLAENEPEIGDTVIISSGRKYPIGTTFVISNFSEFTDRFGRVQTTYALNEDGSIKININNLNVVVKGVTEFTFSEMIRG